MCRVVNDFRSWVRPRAVAEDPAEGAVLRHARPATVPLRRRLMGAGVGSAGLPLLTVVLVHGAVDLSTALLSYLALGVVVATVGGLWPSVVTAVAGFVAGNWFFTPPFRTWTVDRLQDVVALAVFLFTAVVVSALVDLVARRADEARRAGAESTALARLAATVARSEQPLHRLVGDLRDTFGLDAAAVLTRDGEGWRVRAAAGESSPGVPEEGTDVLELDAASVLVLCGPHTPVDDQRILAAFAAQLALAIHTERLAVAASKADALAKSERVRTALLSAVSHDLRTPLATIKAWLSGLLEGDVEFDAEATGEILRAAVGEVDRLNTLVGNLLDMSRLQTGALVVHSQQVDLDAVCAAAIAGLGYTPAQVQLDISDHLQPVQADAALLERILANLIDNAVRHSTPTGSCEVQAAAADGAVEVRVVDRGPGIPPQQRDRAFEPFRRFADHTGGVGLGLAVARGLAEAISAELWIDDTPGGGATMALRLQVAP